MKKCLIVVNTKKRESQASGKKIAEFLLQNGIASQFFNFDGFSDENPFSGFDFVITLGGDGTVLFAARGCAKLAIPVFPVNFGEFGFIASVQKNEWQKDLKDFLDGKLPCETRSMVQASLVNSSGERNFFSVGLNDVVICAKTAARTILMEVMYNCVSLGNFKADGIIISTPTGSTAYSVSAGGPIIDPELDALVLTPINSFSLSSRPLVLSPKGEIAVKILPSRDNAVITVDGQKPFELFENDFIKIRRTSEKVILAGCTSNKFYGALKSKLNWAGGPHA